MSCIFSKWFAYLVVKILLFVVMVGLTIGMVDRLNAGFLEMGYHCNPYFLLMVGVITILASALLLEAFQEKIEIITSYCLDQIQDKYLQFKIFWTKFWK